jgi:hypothetical protein
MASSASEQKQKNKVAFILSLSFNDTVCGSDYMVSVVDE